MAGRLVVSTLNNDTGVLNVQNGMTGIAKAWVNFTDTGSTSIRASFNISSITRNGTADYTMNFTTAMPDANYAVNGCAATSLTQYGFVTGPITTAPTSSAFRFKVPNWTGSGFADTNATYVFVSVFSS